MSGVRRAIWLLAALPWTIGAGCGLFETRSPVRSEAQESLWTTPTSAEIVVENLRLALETRNFTDYQRALTEDFAFQADASDVATIALERPGEMIYENWDRAVEATTAETIWAGLDDLELVLTPIDNDGGVPEALLKYSYRLTLTASGGVSVLVGEAWFQIRQTSNGEWYIFDWRDVAPSDSGESWGLLKGRNRTS